MMNHFMLAVKTAGDNVNSAIVSVACVVFDPNTGTIHDTLDCDIDLNSGSEIGTICPTALRYFMNISDEAQQKIVDGRLSLYETLCRLRFFIEKYTDDQPIIWTNGDLTFNVIRHAYRYCATRCNPPWEFHHQRDVRTLVNTAREITETHYIKQVPYTGIRHTAISDAMHQVAYLSNVYRLIATTLKQHIE